MNAAKRARRAMAASAVVAALALSGCGGDDGEGGGSGGTAEEPIADRHLAAAHRRLLRAGQGRPARVRGLGEDRQRRGRAARPQGRAEDPRRPVQRRPGRRPTTSS